MQNLKVPNINELLALKSKGPSEDDELLQQNIANMMSYWHKNSERYEQKKKIARISQK